jgi:hypothetical protein
VIIVMIVILVQNMKIIRKRRIYELWFIKQRAKKKLKNNAV